MTSDHFDRHVVSPTQLLTFILPIYMFGSCVGFRVYPRLLERRSADDRLILHVHSGLTITLEKSSILAKKLYLESSSFDDSHTTALDGEDLEKSLYHNSEHMSSLHVQRVGSGVEVRGILNHQLRIAPAVVVDHSNAQGIPHRIFDVQERSTSSSAKDM
ncbi:uncharacterized protein LOC119402031 isoform X2 [Rhipicephalus sanguineus]|uniref:uncharacterized protein LOC119402031 isoform X2 n=1 Tax=Rhipicephalus sanguineus TaxID=34632 RepID=UPI0020C493FB|nr:uncharacterized protein LOC119402031 isoform X2 [Rhipicephalus sanguineus]